MLEGPWSRSVPGVHPLSEAWIAAACYARRNRQSRSRSSSPTQVGWVERSETQQLPREPVTPSPSAGQTVLRKPAGTGMEPILRRFYETVLHRIEMRIFHMTPEIDFVPNPALPKTAPPDPFFTLVLSGSRNRSSAGFTAPPAEPALDCAPTHREIPVSLRESPDGIQVIRKGCRSIIRRNVPRKRAISAGMERISVLL